MRRIAIVEDSQQVLSIYRRWLGLYAATWQVDGYLDLGSFQDGVVAQPPDVVVLDLNLPDSKGMDTFHRVVETCPECPIVVVTGLSDLQTARQAMQEGAQDYIPKGWGLERDRFVRAIRYALNEGVLGFKAHRKHNRGLCFLECYGQQLDDHRVPNGGWVTEAVCAGRDGCHSAFIVPEAVIQATLTVLCPQCGCTVKIADVPEDVKQRISERSQEKLLTHD